MKYKIWEILYLGLKVLAIDVIVSLLFGGVIWFFSWIGFFTIGSVLFWILTIILVPLAIIIYLWLKGLLTSIILEID